MGIYVDDAAPLTGTSSVRRRESLAAESAPSALHRPNDVCVFDPSPLLTVTIEPAASGSEIHFHPGGQGFWIARMAQRLGSTVTLVGSFGGESGGLIAPLIRGQGVSVIESPASGDNGSYVQDRRLGERLTVADAAPRPLTRHEADDLYGVMLSQAPATSVAVLAGPREESVVPAETYGRLAADLNTLGTTVIADLSGEALLSALAGGVDVLKVSEDDALRDGLLVGHGCAERLRLLANLHQRGAATVILTRADHPSLVLAEQHTLQIVSPRLRVMDHRGAGDAMTAAIAVALSVGAPTIDAIRMGGAAGAAAVTRRGLASGRRDAVQALVPFIEIRPVTAE